MTDRVIDPCATCGHSPGSHHHYYGAGLRPGGFGKCLKRDCPCELYVEDCTPEQAEKAA